MVDEVELELGFGVGAVVATGGGCVESDAMPDRGRRLAPVPFNTGGRSEMERGFQHARRAQDGALNDTTHHTGWM